MRYKYALGFEIWINRNNQMIPVLPLGKYMPSKSNIETIGYFLNKTDAQKVCDLLNEVSRSQGKHT